MQLIPTAFELGLPDLAAPRLGILRRRQGLDDGERALVSMIAAREAGFHAEADRYAFEAAELVRDPFAVALLIEEGLPAPLTGRIGALADAAGALAAPLPVFERAEMRRLEAQRVDLDEIVDLIVTVATVQARLRAAIPGGLS